MYLFRGSNDHGEGRKPFDATPYEAIEFHVRGTAPIAWVKVGHPVFDQAFTQQRLDGVTGTYRRFRVPLPEKRGALNTLFAISVEPGATLFVDEIRLVP